MPDGRMARMFYRLTCPVRSILCLRLLYCQHYAEQTWVRVAWFLLGPNPLAAPAVDYIQHVVPKCPCHCFVPDQPPRWIRGGEACHLAACVLCSCTTNERTEMKLAAILDVFTNCMGLSTSLLPRRPYAVLASLVILSGRLVRSELLLGYLAYLSSKQKCIFPNSRLDITLGVCACCRMYFRIRFGGKRVQTD